MTTARELAALFGDNGQTRHTADGRNMLEVARDLGAAVEYPNGHGHGHGQAPLVYVFDDGSAVVEMDGGWDYRAEGCETTCWAGVGCQCATTNVREAVRGYDGHSVLCGTWAGPPTDAANDDARGKVLEGLRTAGFHVFSEDLSVLNDGTWEVDAHDAPEDDVC
jgi:hypothetical protein